MSVGVSAMCVLIRYFYMIKKSTFVDDANLIIYCIISERMPSHALKIWFDILTPKEILFFTPMAQQLAKKHTVVRTGRRYRELEGLAKIHDIDLRIIGRHGGGDRAEKLRASVARVARLQRFVEKEMNGIDIAISFCSPEAARVSYGLGINHIAFFDSPHIIPQLKLTVPLIQRLITPSYIPKSSFVRYGIDANRIMTYTSFDAAYIISQYPSGIAHRTVPFSRFDTNSGKKDAARRIILFRVAEEQSAYVSADNNMRQILRALADRLDNVKVVVLARYADQIKNLQKEFKDDVTILTKSYDGRALLENADLFVGSGGTMTSESALLGVPTISTNAVPNWGEQFLVRKGVLHRASNPDMAVKLAKKMLSTPRDTYAAKARLLFESMEDPYPVLEKAIELLK